MGKLLGLILNIIMIPIVLILAIPMAIFKSKEAKKNRLLYSGEEQAWLGKAQRTINMDENALLKPDRDLLIVARCIEKARADYQIIKNRERFDKSFSDFVIPKIKECAVNDWDNVISFFGFSGIELDEVEVKNSDSIDVDELMQSLQNYISDYRKRYGVFPESLMLDGDVHMMFAHAGVYRNAEKYFGNIQIIPLGNMEGGVIWKANPPKPRQNEIQDFDNDFFESFVEIAHLEQIENSTKTQNSKPEVTSPFEPKLELQSEQDMHNYLARLSSFDRSTLCVEFANVRAAKYNLMSMQTALNDFQKVQKLVTDLNDKSLAICLFVFGQPAVFGYNGGDLRSFNDLVNKIDDRIANLNLDPEQHGEQLLKRLGEHLQAAN